MESAATYFTALALTFLSPYGEENEVVPSSYTLSNAGQYSTNAACESAGANIPEILLNQTDVNFVFRQTSACVPSVSVDSAKAFLNVGAVVQYNGIRFQLNDQTGSIPMADMGSCLDVLAALQSMEPDYTLDNKLIIYGKCDAN